jgi:hypothetical protein
VMHGCGQFSSDGRCLVSSCLGFSHREIQSITFKTRGERKENERKCKMFLEKITLQSYLEK